MKRNVSALVPNTETSGMQVAESKGEIERLEARIPKQLKEILRYAADLSGVSLTDFVIMSIQRAAETTIREHNVITLSARDSAMFAEALLNPGEPNEALRTAYSRYKQQVISR